MAQKLQQTNGHRILIHSLDPKPATSCKTYMDLQDMKRLMRLF